MTDYITPGQAEDLLEGYREREDSAYYLPESIGEAALSMIAGARVEYAVARDTDYSDRQYLADWGWAYNSCEAMWLTVQPPLRGEHSYIITRLVIDLGEVGQ